VSGDYSFFAGWRSDPFFFDTMGALNNLQFTGTDFFAEADVCSIVLEVPNSALGTGKIGLWHRTVDGASGKWVQADRGALPSQSVFLTGERKADYLAGGWRVRCCRTFFFMIPRAQRRIRTMAGSSPTTLWMSSSPSSQKWKGDDRQRGAAQGPAHRFPLPRSATQGEII